MSVGMREEVSRLLFLSSPLISHCHAHLHELKIHFFKLEFCRSSRHFTWRKRKSEAMISKMFMGSRDNAPPVTTLHARVCHEAAAEVRRKPVQEPLEKLPVSMDICYTHINWAHTRTRIDKQISVIGWCYSWCCRLTGSFSISGCCALSSSGADSDSGLLPGSQHKHILPLCSSRRQNSQTIKWLCNCGVTQSWYNFWIYRRLNLCRIRGFKERPSNHVNRWESP